MERYVYKINYYNPLLYVFILLSIPFALILSIFTDDDLISHLKEIWYYLKGNEIYYPKKLLRAIYIVRKIKP